jgi:hypothetical protein
MSCFSIVLMTTASDPFTPRNPCLMGWGGCNSTHAAGSNVLPFSRHFVLRIVVWRISCHGAYCLPRPGALRGCVCHSEVFGTNPPLWTMYFLFVVFRHFMRKLVRIFLLFYAVFAKCLTCVIFALILNRISSLIFANNRRR